MSLRGAFFATKQSPRKWEIASLGLDTWRDAPLLNHRSQRHVKGIYDL